MRCHACTRKRYEAKGIGSDGSTCALFAVGAAALNPAAAARLAPPILNRPSLGRKQLRFIVPNIHAFTDVKRTEVDIVDAIGQLSYQHHLHLTRTSERGGHWIPVSLDRGYEAAPVRRHRVERGYEDHGAKQNGVSVPCRTHVRARQRTGTPRA